MDEILIGLCSLYTIVVLTVAHGNWVLPDRIYLEKLEKAQEYCKDSGVKYVEQDMSHSDVHCKDGAVYYDVLTDIHVKPEENQ